MNWCLQNSLSRNRKSFVKLRMKLTLGRKLVGLSLSNSGGQPIQKRSRGLRPRQKAKAKAKGKLNFAWAPRKRRRVCEPLPDSDVPPAASADQGNAEAPVDVQVVGEDHDLPAGPQQDAQAPVDLATHLPTDPSDNEMKWWFLLRKWKLKLIGNNLLDQMLGQMQKLEKNEPEVDEQPRPVRGPGRGYINAWQDVLCNVCGQVAGEIKLDPGPANRDQETWFMRVKEGDRWASKYPKFRRRTANVIGISDDFATGWVHENRTCCDGAAP